MQYRFYEGNIAENIQSFRFGCESYVGKKLIVMCACRQLLTVISIRPKASQDGFKR